MKFGGTSVGDLKKISNVADIVKKNLKIINLLLFLSAMAGSQTKCKIILMKLNQKKN